MAESGYYSTFLADAVLSAICRNTALDPMEHIHLALYETLPDRDDEGGTECTFTGYARIQAAVGATSVFDAPTTEDSRRCVKNTGSLVWGENTGGSPVTIEGIAIYDQGNTNLLFIVPCAATIGDHVVFELEAGDLVVGLDSSATATYEMQDRILKAVFHNTAISVPTALYVELQSTLTTKATGADGVAAAYTGYAGITLDAGASSEWDAPAAFGDYRSCDNSAEVNFGKNTGDTEVILGFTIFEDDDEGNALIVRAFDAPLSVVENMVPTFKAGDLDVSL